jgi:NADPH:quinone reductase-like Zn-dependent oxidoreductase
VDYKVAERPLVANLAATMLASPGTDFVGQVVKSAAGSPLKEGQLVFGAAGVGLVAGGALAEYAVANKNAIAAVPDDF